MTYYIQLWRYICSTASFLMVPAFSAGKRRGFNTYSVMQKLDSSNRVGLSEAMLISTVLQRSTSIALSSSPSLPPSLFRSRQMNFRIAQCKAAQFYTPPLVLTRLPRHHTYSSSSSKIPSFFRTFFNTLFPANPNPFTMSNARAELTNIINGNAAGGYQYQITLPE